MQMMVSAHCQLTVVAHPTEPTHYLPALPVACAGTNRMPALRLRAFVPRNRWYSGCTTTTTQGRRTSALSSALSATPSFGHVVGCLRLRGTHMVCTVGSTDVQLCSCTLATYRLLSKPLLLTTVITVVPLPTFVVPLPSPPCSWERRCRPDTLAPTPVCRWHPGDSGGVRQMCAHVPSSDQSCNCRQHVLAELFFVGRSAQVPPVCSTDRMPFTVRQLSLHRRPRVLFSWG